MKWEKVELKKLIEKPITGEWGEEPQNENEATKVIRTTNFTNEGILNLSKGLAFRKIEQKKIDLKVLKYGDIIIEKSGGSPTQPVGRVVFFDEKDDVYLCNNFTSILRPKDFVYPKFLLYQFFAIHKRGITEGYQNKTTGIINLQLDRFLKDTKIPLPPLHIQQQIGEILDTADALRRATAEQLQLLDDLAQSVFLEMFGDVKANNKKWELKPFNYFAKFDTKMTTDFEKYADYPHIGIGNIEKNTGRIFGYKTVKEENLKSGKYLFSPNHIIYSKIRPNLNKVALPTFHGLASADSYPILVTKNCNKLFLVSLLRSDAFVDFILQHSTRTNIPKANKKQMLLFKGIAPPLALQTEFAKIIENIEAQKAELKKALADSEDMFKGLLQAVFS
jgi:type I restriction enzyme, S subunit